MISQRSHCVDLHQRLPANKMSETNNKKRSPLTTQTNVGGSDERKAAKKQKKATNKDEAQENLTSITETTAQERLKVDQKAIMAILEAVKSDPYDTALVVHVCGCLERLLQRNDDNSAVSIEEGLTLIMSIMIEHPRDIELKEKGGTLFHVMCDKVNDTQEENKMNGIGAIMTTLKYLHSVEELATKCCGTLASLTHTSEMEVNDVNVKHILNAGGIAVVIAAMKAFPNNDALLGYCCVILANLAFRSNDNAIHIAGGGGIKTVVDALKAHTDSGWLQAKAVGALNNLIAFQECFEESMSADGLLHGVITAMKQHSGNKEVQKCGCAIFATSAAYNKGGKHVKHIVEVGGIPLVVAAMKRHPNCALLQCQACLFFWKLADEYKDAIIVAHGLDVISTAFRVHRNHVDLQKAAKDAMSSLMEVGKE